MNWTSGRLPLLRVALFLGLAGAISAALVLPYQVHLQMASGVVRPAWTMQMPAWTLWLLSAVQNAVPLLLFVPAGLWASRRLGLGAPLIEALVDRRPVPRGTASALGIAAFAGLAAGAAILTLDLTLFVQVLSQAALSPQSSPPAWKGFLASFYGGINEELMSRLFFLSFLALGLRTVARALGADRNHALPAGIFWAANALAALVFAAAHLPAAAALGSLTTGMVIRIFVLNGLAATLFGWLFWRKGLEAAMVAHFCADLVLHVVAPVLLMSA